MKNAIKTTIIIGGAIALFTLTPDRCKPQGEGEMEYLSSSNQIELVAPKALKA